MNPTAWSLWFRWLFGVRLGERHRENPREIDFLVCSPMSYFFSKKVTIHIHQSHSSSLYRFGGTHRVGKNWPHSGWATEKDETEPLHLLLKSCVFCHSHCLQSAIAAGPLPSISAPDVSLVPPEDHDLGEVCSQQWAVSLPPHHTVNLLPAATLPTRVLTRERLWRNPRLALCWTHSAILLSSGNKIFLCW